MEEQLKLVHKVIDVFGVPKQKDLCNTTAIQGEQPRHLLCSGSSIRTEDGGRKISTNCVRINKLDEFVYLLDVMNSVYGKVIANQPICNVL